MVVKLQHYLEKSEGEMRRGVWHQCGDRSQRLVLEQLESNNGVGVIISPRDLSFPNACDYAQQYRELGADVIVDLQFYNPQFQNAKLGTYPINEFRVSISDSHEINDNQLDGFANSLRNINESIEATALLAPALPYEPGRNDIVDLNMRLFSIAKHVGDDLGIPTFGSILLSRSVTVSEPSITSLLSSATSLNCDGWYYGFEFSQKRIPENYEDIYRFGVSLLTLANTGKPVMHSYAGPLSLLSMGFGSTGIALGHSQNLWQFTRGRWEDSTGSQGGGGDAPPRYFSKNLWGTFVYPDELVQLSSVLRQRLLSPTPFSGNVGENAGYSWERWEANKHLLYIIGDTITQQSLLDNSRAKAEFAINLLTQAIQLKDDIEATGLVLKDKTCCYQNNWLQAITNILQNYSNDYDYLSLL